MRLISVIILGLRLIESEDLAGEMVKCCEAPPTAIVTIPVTIPITVTVTVINIQIISASRWGRRWLWRAGRTGPGTW
jgi:hypothetical protein